MPRPSALLLPLVALLGAAFLHCASESFTSTAGDGGNDSAAPGDSGGIDAAPEASADAGAGDAAPTCVSNRGPSMVAVPLSLTGAHYCIDSTEVTAGQYAAFVADLPANVSPPDCAWNTSFTPLGTAQGDNYPVTGVDQCDAIAFCTWAGKRLCGSTRGGPVDAGDYMSAAATTDSQWYRACSMNGSRSYPYGSNYTDGTCEVDRRDSGLIPVSSKAGCVGGYPGIFDMAGNADEWEDSCFDGGGSPGTEFCMVRGSDWYRESYFSQCNRFIGEGSTGHPFTRSLRGPSFRCCKDE